MSGLSSPKAAAGLDGRKKEEMPLNLSDLTIPQIRYLTDSSLFYFIKIFGRASGEAGEDSIEEIHKPLCDFWQDPNNKRIGIGMPRDWFKSTDFTCWDAIRDYLLNPEERQLVAMEKAGLAKKKLSFIKQQLLRNQLLRKVYRDRLWRVTPAWTKDKDNRWSSEIIDLPRDGLYADPSIQIVGIKTAVQSGHFTQIRLDDIIGKAALDSPDVVMKNAFSWVDNLNELTVDPHWERPSGSRIKIVGSPWGEGDVYDYTRREYPEYKWMIAPALKDTDLKDTEQVTWVQNSNVGHDESNFPELFTTDYYKKMQASPEKQSIFWSQHQCNPQKATGLTKIEKGWIHFYRIEDRIEGGINKRYLICDKCNIEVALSDLPLYGMADVAGFGEIKSMKGAARNALLIGGQPIDKIQKFVVYAWAQRLKKPSAFREKLYEAQKEYKPRAWRIDDKGVGSTMFGDILEERLKKCPTMKISPLPHDAGKDQKDSDIQALINPIAQGEIHLHETMTDLKAELLQYPRGLTKDLIDMLAKLNRIYWVRNKMVDVSKFAEESHVWSVQSRDGVTGY